MRPILHAKKVYDVRLEGRGGRTRTDGWQRNDAGGADDDEEEDEGRVDSRGMRN